MDVKAPHEKKRKITLYSATVFMLSICLLIFVWMAYRTYMNDESTVISQQEQQLLTIAKLTGKNLAASFNEEIRNLQIVAGNHAVAQGMGAGDRASVRGALEAYYTAKKGTITRVCQVSKAGKIVESYPQLSSAEENRMYGMIADDLSDVLAEQKSRIGGAVLDQPGGYAVNLFQPVFLDGKLEGVLVSTVDLNTVYNHLVKPVRVGKKGYIHVKNGQGKYLMHSNEANIGISLADLKRLHPGLDFSDLEKLMDLQFTQDEGTMIYNSYWWTDRSLSKSRKFEAFVKIRFDRFFWVVAAAMDYDEVKEPIARSRMKTIGIFTVIILILSSAIVVIMKEKKKQAALEIETKYLREFNATGEQLRKKDLQLQHARKLQVIGSLTGGIAHDFNNLLTPIQGYAEIIMGKLDRKHELYEYAGEIYGASAKARDIIEQILVFSRADNGAAQHTPLKVGELVDEALNLLKPILPPHVEVIFAKKSENAVMLANKVQIHQVILNLCNNAFQAMKHSGGILKITLQVVGRQEVKPDQGQAVISESPRFIKLSVSDTGHGMNSETISRIFDPFFTTKPGKEGTGLGLFIVYGIVENHQGSITVQSAVGRGSEFTVYFPQADCRERERDTQSTVRDFGGRSKEVFEIENTKSGNRGNVRIERYHRFH